MEYNTQLARRWAIFLSLGLIFVFAFTAYSATWHVPFVFDDIPAIPNDGYVPYFDFQARDFAILLGGLRSIPNLTFGINYYFGGTTVVGYHVVNFVIHVFVGWTLFFLGFLLSRRSLPTTVLLSNRFLTIDNHLVLGLVAALLFVVHPLQTMAVTYIVQRLTSLMTLFYVFTLLAYVLARSRGWHWGWGIAAACSAVLAVLSKQNSATLPLALLLVEFMFFSRSLSGLGRRWVYFVPIFVLLLFVPLSVVGLMPFRSFDPFDPPSFFQALDNLDLWQLVSATNDIGNYEYLLTEFRVIARYLGLLLLPIHQNIDHDVSLSHNLFDPITTLFSLLLLGVVFVCSLVLWRRGVRVAAFGILLFFLGLAIESSFIVLPDVMFEYRMYLPMVGVALVVGDASSWLLVRGMRWRLGEVSGVTLGSVVIVAVLILLTVVTYHRNLVWRDPVVLWADAVAKSPAKSRPLNNLGTLYLGQERWDDAREVLERVIELDPDYSPAYNNLGLIYSHRGDLDTALSYYLMALERDPDYAHAHNNVGTVYVQRGDTEAAAAAFERAVALSPRYVSARDNLGMVYFQQKKYDAALSQFEQALAVDPLHAVSYNNRGVVYMQLGRVDEARRAFRQALELDPDHFNARENLKLLDGVVGGGLNVLN